MPRRSKSESKQKGSTAEHCRNYYDKNEISTDVATPQCVVDHSTDLAQTTAQETMLAQKNTTLYSAFAFVFGEMLS